MPGTTCRLYLIAPDPLPDGFADMLQSALQGGDVAALRIGPGGTGDAAFLSSLAPIRGVAQAADVALLLQGPRELARQGGFDGVHMLEEALAPGLRDQLGALQLGIWCGASRDAAMLAGDAGADYVTFGPFDETRDAADPDLIAWWAELMELPVVAEGGITLDNCAALIDAGADFLAVGDAVWRHDAGPCAAIRAFNAAIATHDPRSDQAAAASPPAPV